MARLFVYTHLRTALHQASEGSELKLNDAGEKEGPPSYIQCDL